MNIKLLTALLVFFSLPIGSTAYAVEYTVLGHVFGVKDKKSVENVRIVAYRVTEDSTKSHLLYRTEWATESAISDRDGNFELVLNSESKYRIEAVEETHFMETFTLMKQKGIAAGETIRIELPMRRGSSLSLSETYLDKDTRQPLAEIRVQLDDPVNKVTRSVLTDAKGRYYFTVPKEGQYILSANADNYLHSGFDPLEIRTKNYQDFSRKLTLQRVSVGYKKNLGDLGYYINEGELTESGKEMLLPLYQLLANNPNIRIEFACHTDSRGDDEYNFELSQKRADAAVVYLGKLGIPYARMTSKGYGETRLINECENGVKCSTKQHEKNRRAEFEITAME